MTKKIAGNLGVVLIFSAFLVFCACSLPASPQPGQILVSWTAEASETEGEVPWESDYPASLLPGEKINVNTATAADLERLPSIGEGRAAAIIGYRESQGDFTEIEQLTNISGIGDGILTQIQDYITLE